MKIKKIWNNPVWSNVIAHVIIWTFITLGTVIWTFIKSNQNDINFITAFIEVMTIKISLWITLLCIILLYMAYWTLTNLKRNRFSYNENSMKIDRILFNKIRYELLPQNGAISFIRENNFAGFSFDIDRINDLRNIEHEGRMPDFEFLNPKLEKIKEELITHIANFSKLISHNTYLTHNGLQTIPPEWEHEQPVKFRKIVNEIHNETSLICNKYDELIKTGRRVFAEQQVKA